MISKRVNRIPIACAILLSAQGCVAPTDDLVDETSDPDTQDVAAQTATPQIPDIVFGDVKAIGTGCKAGSYSIAYDDHETPGVGHKAFAVFYNEYKIEVSASTPLAEANCTLEVPVKAPTGWQYAVGQFVFRGRYTLEPQVRGSVDVSYGFKGLPQVKLTNKRSMSGPANNQLFEYTDSVRFNDITDLSWSSCKDFRSLVIDSSLALQSDTQANGSLSMIRTEGSKGTQPGTGTRSRATGDDDDSAVELDVSSQKTTSGAFVGVFLRRCP